MLFFGLLPYTGLIPSFQMRKLIQLGYVAETLADFFDIFWKKIVSGPLYR